MAAPNDPSLSRVRVSTSENGTYTNVGYVRSADLSRGSDGDTTLYWFGGEAAKAGNRTLAATFPIYWDDGDTLGQSVIDAAWASGATLWFQVAPKGVATGAKVQQFSGTVTEAPITMAADGDAVEGSFSVRGNPSSLTTVTLA